MTGSDSIDPFLAPTAEERIRGWAAMERPTCSTTTVVSTRGCAGSWGPRSPAVGWPRPRPGSSRIADDLLDAMEKTADSEVDLLRSYAFPLPMIVVPALPAANRDAKHATDPDVLDVARSPNSHLAFGHGVHHCLGAPLARLEARIALASLLARFPNLKLAVAGDRLTWRPSLLFNALTELPIRLR